MRRLPQPVMRSQEPRDDINEVFQARDSGLIFIISRFAFGFISRVLTSKYNQCHSDGLRSAAWADEAAKLGTEGSKSREDNVFLYILQSI